MKKSLLQILQRINYLFVLYTDVTKIEQRSR